MIMQYHGIYSTDCRKQPFNNNKRYLFCELIFMLIRWVVEATTFKRMENCMKSAKQYNWFSQFLIQFYFVNSSEYFHIFWICIPDFSFRWVPFWQWNIASFFPALLILLIPFCEWIAFKINILLMMNWINEWMNEERERHQDVLLCAFCLFNATKFSKTPVSVYNVLNEMFVFCTWSMHSPWNFFLVDRFSSIHFWSPHCTPMHMDVICK